MAKLEVTLQKLVGGVYVVFPGVGTAMT